ncbi:MAG: DUF3352 domain-containing protein [Acidobacteriota bacterium]
MRKFELISRPLTLVLTLFLIASPLVGQKRTGTRKKPATAAAVEPAVTFDTLLTDDSYRLYSELRNVGQLVRSSGFNDLLEPIIKLGEPPKEFKTILKWMNAHAEALASSRMFAASWPTKPKLPTVLIAVEFSTVEEAKKFESELRSLMPRLMPKPSPSPAASPGSISTPASPATLAQSENVADQPQYVIKQTGSLVLLTDKPLSLRDLKPRGSKLLAEDPNFALARNRFASEAVFIYVDVKSIEKEQLEQRKKWEEEELRRKEAEAANPTAPEIASTELEELTPQMPPVPVPVEEPSPTAAPSIEITAQMPVTNAEASSNPTLSSSPVEVSGPMDGGMFSLWSLIFGGQPKWPEAIGVAIAFEDEGYVVRALIVDGPENKGNAIPFVPQFVSGPAIALGSPNVMPADTELFVSASLDYAQMYEGMVKAMAGAEELTRRVRRQPVANTPPASPFAEYEKKLGLKVKDDILPLLGHELALVIPKKQPQPSPSPTPGVERHPDDGPTFVRAPDQTPIIAISVKDKEAVRKLIPKIVEALAGKGVNLFAQTEKRDDTEITSYANIFSYAFIGDFLVVTPDPVLTRQVVDSYLKNQTLASDSHFRNSTRWQPRQVQGQIYAGPGVIDLVSPLATGATVNEKMRELLLRVNPVIDPLTYALSNEGLGPLHELHIPKNLLMLMIAGITSQANESPIITNESIAKSVLRTIASAEATFHSTKGAGRYATLDELATEGLVPKDLLERYGYKIEINVVSNKFEATAMPIEYGKTGRRSYFVDESGVLRGGDHGGGAATIADKPVE